jgi:UDP-N-acetylglucosamine 2-epimerase
MVLVVFGRPSRVVRREQYEKSAEEVLRAAAANPDLRFVVKVHPSDTSGFWPSVASDRRLPNLRVTISDDFYQLLREAWVVVTRHSTAGAEAICGGKPVAVVDTGSELGEAGTDGDYVEFGAAYVVREAGALLSVLGDLKATKPGEDALASRREEYAARFMTRGSEPAAKRASSLLVELAQSTAGASK